MTDTQGSPPPSLPLRPSRIPQQPLDPTFSGPTVIGVKRRFEDIGQSVVRISKYVYAPIDDEHQIRILKIAPGSDDKDIFCHLTLETLESRYEALSYFWGNHESSNEIKIMTTALGKVKYEIFYIKPNLFAALRAFRDPVKEVNLWVDAICINQDDDAEKKSQVAKMEEIYSKAQRVLIWLGEPEPSTEMAFELIEEMCNLRRLDFLITSDNEAKWDALADLERNVWFSRRWVVQEIALAREASLHSGRHSVHWDDFADAIAFHALKFDAIKEILPGKKLGPNDPPPLQDVVKLGPHVLVDATSNLFRRSEDGEIIERRQTLETLISTLTAYEASDPRDTIYAILSLAKDTTRSQTPFSKLGNIQDTRKRDSNLGRDHGIRPDYEKDVMEVCKDFVNSCYDCTHSLDILCRHWAPVLRGFTSLDPRELKRGLTLEQKNWATQRQLPTWMPCITGAAYGAPKDSLGGRVHGDSLVGQPNRQYYNASFGIPAEVTFGETDEDPLILEYRTKSKISNSSKTPQTTQSPKKVSDGTMSVKGLRIDTLDQVGRECPYAIIDKESLAIGGLSSTHETPPDELWRTMVADRGPEGANAPKWYLRACGHALAQSPQGHIDTRTLVKENRDSMMVEFLKRVRDVVWSRKFFRTRGDGLGERKRLGLGPTGTEKGDIVCILYGCTVPVVLRERPDKDGFEFVGECYLHGMMDGEAIWYMTKTQLAEKEEVFKLR